MNIQQAVERIRRLDKDLIPEALEDLERYREIATACTPRYENDGAQHTTNGNSKERAFIECGQASIKVDKLKQESAMLKNQLQATFDKMIINDKNRRIAKLYYLDYLKQNEIAKKINYSESTIKQSIQKVNETLNIVPNCT